MAFNDLRNILISLYKRVRRIVKSLSEMLLHNKRVISIGKKNCLTFQIEPLKKGSLKIK